MYPDDDISWMQHGEMQIHAGSGPAAHVMTATYIAALKQCGAIYKVSNRQNDPMQRIRALTRLSQQARFLSTTTITMSGSRYFHHYQSSVLMTRHAQGTLPASSARPTHSVGLCRVSQRSIANLR